MIDVMVDLRDGRRIFIPYYNISYLEYDIDGTVVKLNSGEILYSKEDRSSIQHRIDYCRRNDEKNRSSR